MYTRTNRKEKRKTKKKKKKETEMREEVTKDGINIPWGWAVELNKAPERSTIENDQPASDSDFAWVGETQLDVEERSFEGVISVYVDKEFFKCNKRVPSLSRLRFCETCGGCAPYFLGETT